VNPEAESLREVQLMPRSVSHCILNEDFDHASINVARRTFRTCGNASAGQRAFLSRCADGARLSPGRVACQPSACRCQRGFAGGPKRAALARAFARRHVREHQASSSCGGPVISSRRRPDAQPTCFTPPQTNTPDPPLTDCGRSLLRQGRRRSFGLCSAGVPRFFPRPCRARSGGRR